MTEFILQYLVMMSIVSYVARPMRIQFVDPFICGRLKIKIDKRFPTNPSNPTQFKKTPWKTNSNTTSQPCIASPLHDDSVLFVDVELMMSNEIFSTAVRISFSKVVLTELNEVVSNPSIWLTADSISLLDIDKPFGSTENRNS